MQTAKLVLNGKYQAVHLPVEFAFDGDEVYVKKIGHCVYLFPKNKQSEAFLDGLSMFPDDFVANGRVQAELPQAESS